MSSEAFFYVGTYTNQTAMMVGKGKGIYLIGVHRSYDTIKLKCYREVGITDNPSYILCDRTGKYLFAVNELYSNPPVEGLVTAFSIDPSIKSLSSTNHRSSCGQGPCYVSIDRTEAFLFVANYSNGRIASYPIRDGTLGEVISEIQHTGSGPHPHQDGPHTHSILVDPGNRFVYALDLGADKIYIYRLNLMTGQLMKPEVNFVMTDPGDGPRHLAFHPNGQIMYVVTELSSSIIAYRVDGETGIPVQFQKVSTLPDGHADVGYAADIHVHPSGRFLYASNRGHNSIAVYAINAEGKLSVIEYVDTKGKIPRSFSLSDDGSMLLVANQNSNSIVLFLVDEETGRLIDLDMQVVVPTPTCIKSYPVH